jgi:hypothetical protein
MWSDKFIKQLESRNSSYRDDLKFWWRRPLEIVDIMTAYDEENEITKAIYLLKSKGYKILKPNIEFTEV